MQRGLLPYAANVSPARLTAWLLGAALLVCPRTAFAQTVEVAPFGGYRFGGGLYEVITGTSLDVDGAPAVGVTLDVFVNRGSSVSFLYSHQETRLDGEDARSAGVPDTTLSIDHWHVGGTQAFGSGVSQPFLTGSLGLTQFGSDFESELRFSMAGGGGVKLMPSRHLGVRLEGRVYAVFVDGESRGSICTPGTCLIGVNVSVIWQAEFTAGVVLSF